MTDTKTLSQTTFAVTGMTCGGCQNTVATALRNTSGVVTAAVDLKTKTAQVQFDSDLTTVDKVMAAVRATGYGAEPLEGR